jgi:hypothetical protein
MVNSQKSTTMSKKSFVLRLDEAAYAALEKWAADDFRSVNGQLEWIISKALKEAGRVPKEKKKEAPPEEEAEK